MSTRDNPYPFTFLSEDIIDLSNLNYDDEETWLYVSSSRTPENETFNRNLWLEESRRELQRMYVVGNSPGGELCSSEVNINYEIADDMTFSNIQLIDMSCGDSIDINPMDFAIGAPTLYNNNLESSYISFRSMSPPSLVGSFMEHMDLTAGHDITYIKGEAKSPSDRTFIQSTNDQIITNKTSSPTANYPEKCSINMSNISLKENTFIKSHQERSSECLLNVTYDFNCLSDLSLSNNFSKSREINQEKSGIARRSVCLQKKIEAEMNLAARGGSIDSLDGISSESDISASPVSPRPLNLEDVQERARLQEQSLLTHVSTPVHNVVRSVLPDDSLVISPILRTDEKSPPNKLTAVDKLHKGNPHYWQPQNDRQNLLNRTLTRNSKTSDVNTTRNMSRKVDHCESLNQSLKELNATHNLENPCEVYTNLNETKELHARKNLSVKLNALNTTYDAENVSDNNAPPAIPKLSRLPPPSKLIRPTSRHSLRSSPSPPAISPSPPTVLPEKAQSAHCSPICSPHGSSQNLTTKVPQFQSQRDLKNLGKPLTMIPQYGSEKQLYKRDLQLRSLRPPSTTRSKLLQPTKPVPNITTDNIKLIENKVAEESKLIKPIPKRPSGLPQPAVRPSGLPRPRTGIPRMPFTRAAPSYQNGLPRFGAPRRNIDDF